MFESYPTYSPFRTLRLGVRGEDVYAWQTVLRAHGYSVLLDGVFSQATLAATVAVQKLRGTTPDGLVGGETWRLSVDWLARFIRRSEGLPQGTLYGQIAHESSFRGGIVSPQRADGTYDAGVTQHNTAHYPVKLAFDVPWSIKHLAQNTRAFYDLFAGVPEVRRWDLAQGAWNAPAYACWLANDVGAHVPLSRVAKPGPTARLTLEEYIDDVTVYRR